MIGEFPHPNMSESQNYLLFKRNSQDSHDEVWDDSALIQAYDKAVNLAKEKVAAKLALAKDDKNTTSSEDASSSNAETLASPSRPNKQRNWKIGDYVRSAYSEDNVVYEAVIEKITNGLDSCVVKYLGYNNEEEVKLKDLLPSAGASARRKQISEAVDVCSSDDMECEVMYSQSPKRLSSTATPNLKWQPVEPDSSFPPQFDETNHAAMSIPPPPPPVAWPSDTEMSSDALYSMLMSWYMAGYHTGYYQASQQKNKRRHLGPQ